MPRPRHVVRCGVRFEILGRVVALDGARTIELGRPRQRAVLGYLLLSSGRAVPISELVEAVWGGAEPSTARNQIQSDISAIRRRLPGREPTGRPSGYTVSLRPGDLDAAVFADRVRQAQASADAGLLREALTVWRGDPLAGAQAAYVEAARARLTEQWLAAQSALADLELAAGKHEAVAGRLAALLVAHPTREGLVDQLMLASYRCGRVDEALETARRFRERLAQDHGVDPSPAHDELERAIRRRDAALVLPAAAIRLAPAQMPAGPSVFAGRAAELTMLRAMLSSAGSSPVIVAIDGAAGVGKTSLALHWAREAATRYPGGVLYLDLRGHSTEAPVQPEAALAHLLRSLGLAPQQIPADVVEASALYRSMLAGGRYLVLLDNAASADSVRPLLPGAAGSLAIVTSRRRLDGLAVSDGAQTITLDVLDAVDATRLLGRLVGDARVLAEPEATKELVRLCGCLPLAVCIAAARIRDEPTITGYLAELRADRLSALAVPGDDEVAVRSAFARSYRAMDSDSARVFRLLGLLPGPDFRMEAIAAMTGLPQSALRQLVRRLFAAHLIERAGHHRFTLHDLLREYAREHVSNEDAATKRLYSWYVESARAAAEQVYPHMLRLPADEQVLVAGLDFPDAKAAADWLDAEYPNLVEAIRQGVERGQHVATWQLADALRGYLLRRSHLSEWLMIAGSALSAAREAGDERAQAAIHLSLSLAYRSRCDYARTIGHLEDARKLSAAADWVGGEITTLGNLAGVYYDIGSLSEAQDLFVQVLDLSRREGYHGNIAATLSNLGATLRDLGRPVEALFRLTEAVDAFRAMASPSGEADALDNIGTTYHQMGALPDALSALDAALAIHRELGDKRSEASVLTNRTATLAGLGRLGEASVDARRAVDLATGSGSPRTEAEALNAAALVSVAIGEPREALRLALRAHRIATHIGVRQPEIAALIGQAAAHRAIGSADLGVDLATRAHQLAIAYGFRSLAATAHWWMVGSASRCRRRVR